MEGTVLRHFGLAQNPSRYQRRPIAGGCLFARFLHCLQRHRNPLQYPHPFHAARRQPVRLCEVGLVDVQTVQLAVRLRFVHHARPAVGRRASVHASRLNIVPVRVVEHGLPLASGRIEAAHGVSPRAVGRTPGDHHRAVRQWRRAVKLAIARFTQHAKRIQRTPIADARQLPRPVPRNLIGRDEDHQAGRSDARHVVDRRPRGIGEQGVIGPVQIDAEQADSAPRAVGQCAALPA